MDELWRPRVLIADDHLLLLDAFTALLQPTCEVVGTVTDGRALIATALRLKPNIIVLDIAMPLLNGIDAGHQLRQLLPSAKLIFVTMNPDPDLATEALKMGASGYLLKHSAGTELKQAIHEAMRGRTYVTPLTRQSILDASLQTAKPHTPVLTPRQREVLQLLAEGYSMKEVARMLSVTPRTVAFHKYRMMDEFRIKSNAELIRFAVQQGLSLQQLA